MKHFIFHLFLLFTTSSFAGEIIKSIVIVDGETNLSTTYYDDDWIKIIDTDDTMIFDLNRKRVTLINTSLGIYTVADFAEFKSLFMNLQKIALENSSKYGTKEERLKIENTINQLMNKTQTYTEDLQIKATNEKTDIMGYRCFAYDVIENGYVIQKIWRTKKISSLAIPKTAQTLALLTPIKTFETAEKYLEFIQEGTILKTEDLIDQTVTTVTDIIKTKIPASQFFIDEGYQKTTLIDYMNAQN